MQMHSARAPAGVATQIEVNEARETRKFAAAKRLENLAHFRNLFSHAFLGAAISFLAMQTQSARAPACVAASIEVNEARETRHFAIAKEVKNFAHFRNLLSRAFLGAANCDLGVRMHAPRPAARLAAQFEVERTREP